MSSPSRALGTIIEIPVTDIEVRDRVGLFWADKALQIGAAIAADGQNDPIKVRRTGSKAEKPWSLVAGLHRLRGCELAMVPTIHAIEVRGDADELRLIEVSENLHRRDFEPLERAMFVRALADIYERHFYEGREGLSAQQIGQLNRWEAVRNTITTRDADKVDIEAALLEEEYSPDIVSGLSSWQDQLLTDEPVSARILRDCLFIHRTIIAPLDRNLVRNFATHPEGRSRKTLMKIGAIQKEDQRRAVVQWLTNHPGAVLDQALEALGAVRPAIKAPAEGQSKYMNNAQANLDRLSAKSWREWAPTLAQTIKPSSLIAVRDAIEARLKEIGSKTGDDDE